MNMCKCKPRTTLCLRVSYASLGVLLGLVACVVFGVHFGNRDAAIWGLCSSLFAALTISEFLYLYIRKHVKRKTPKEWVMEVFGSIASVGVGAGIGGVATYLALGIQNSLSGNAIYLPTSSYVVCVWCFMTFKWGLTAYLYTLPKYIPMATGRYVPISSTVEPV